MPQYSARVVSIAALGALLAACPGPPKDIELAEQCDQGLKAAYAELDWAKAKGLSGTVDWTKAASLLSAASVQQEFRKYPNCIDKVSRARYYIKQSQK